jgi:hypothetical protein
VVAASEGRPLHAHTLHSYHSSPFKISVVVSQFVSCNEQQVDMLNNNTVITKQLSILCRTEYEFVL